VGLLPCLPFEVGAIGAASSRECKVAMAGK
jgi:hypothetical protein